MRLLAAALPFLLYSLAAQAEGYAALGAGIGGSAGQVVYYGSVEAAYAPIVGWYLHGELERGGASSGQIVFAPTIMSSQYWEPRVGVEREWNLPVRKALVGRVFAHGLVGVDVGREDVEWSGTGGGLCFGDCGGGAEGFRRVSAVAIARGAVDVGSPTVMLRLELDAGFDKGGWTAGTFGSSVVARW